jgi:teichuronic acid biosynthesis glycosyltransferase TuaC
VIPRRLRVLVVARSYPSDVFPTLGLWTESPTVRLARRCDVRVVSPVPWCPPLPAARRLEQYARFRRIPRRDRREGVEILHPRFLTGPARSTYRLEARAYDAGIARTVERLRREFPFDLVHAHFIYPEGVAAHRIAERYGVPLVVTEHAPWSGWLDEPGIARQAIPAARAAARLMPVSHSVLDTMNAYAGASVNAVVIPVGVDLDRFTVGDERTRRRDRIMYAGLINFNKGIDVLLEAMERLAAQGHSARLVLAGGSFYRHTRLQEQRLRARARELGDRVQFIGRQPPEAIARLMASSAAVVLPSRAESFGAVLVEALACGTPVVATRCGGPEDIVVDEVGELVPVGDPASLAQALARTLDEPARYDPLRLRRYAAERFSWDSVVDRIHDVYTTAVS